MLHCVSHTQFLTYIGRYFHFLGGAPLLPSLRGAVKSELALSSASSQRAATPHLWPWDTQKPPKALLPAKTVSSAIQDGSLILDMDISKFRIPGYPKCRMDTQVQDTMVRKYSRWLNGQVPHRFIKSSHRSVVSLYETEEEASPTAAPTAMQRLPSFFSLYGHQIHIPT